MRRLSDEARPALVGITGRLEEGRLSLAGARADAAALAEMTVLLAEAGIRVQAGTLAENSATLLLAPEQTREAMTLVHRELILRQYA